MVFCVSICDAACCLGDSRFHLNGERNPTTSLSPHDSFWLATRLPSMSMMPIIRLLLCRSIPAITFFIGRLSVECCCSSYSADERQLLPRGDRLAQLPSP